MKDFGYFGRGSTGYAHYMQAHNRSHGSGGGGGGNRGSGGSDNWLAMIGGIFLCWLLAAGCNAGCG